MPVTTSSAKDYQTGYSGLTYTTIAGYLKRTLSAADQTLVTQLILDKERELCQQTNRQFKITDQRYYEFFDAPEYKFIPYATPVASVNEILINGVDKTSSYTVGTDFFVYDNLIAFDTPLIASAKSPQAIKLTYTLRSFWGDDIRSLLKRWVSIEFLNSENGGIGLSSVSFAELSQTLNLAGFEKEKKSIIFRYSDFEV